MQHMTNDIEFEKSMLRDMRAVIKQGTLEELKKYFFDSELTRNEIYGDLQHNREQAFLSSCYYGKLSFVQYLLTSPELVTPVDIHCKDDSAIFNAVEGCQTKVIEYLLHSPELKEHISLYKNINEIFDTLIEELYIQDENCIPGDANGISINEEVVEIMDYLIYDYSISPTEHIIRLLKEETKMSYYEPAIKRLYNNLLYNDLVEQTKNTNHNKEVKKIKV
jgi:hypothetical protein